MFKKFLVLQGLLLGTFFFVEGQNGKDGKTDGTGIIYGNLTTENEPLSFASVSIFNQKDSSLSAGAIADEKGKFEFKNLKAGTYYLKASFIGFESFEQGGIKITTSNSIAKLQNLEMKSNSKQLEAVEITSNVPAMEYQIDKKVVNVGKQITATSGTAIDVLQNVPSVQVDITGEVSLRGSSGFMVFIDGRPSVLSGSEALAQIPSSTIEKIEIITNPSAKYDPDGTSGIINVITKKNKLNGFNGVVNGNIGLDDKYGGDILLNYRKNKMNYFIGADYNHRYFPGVERIDRLTTSNDTLYRTKADGISARTRTTYELRGGIQMDIGVHDYLNVNGKIGFREHANSSELDYLESTFPDTGSNAYTSYNLHSRNGLFYSGSVDYEHKFNNDQHKLNGQVVYNQYAMNEVNDNQLILPDGKLNYGQESTERGPNQSFRAKIDYNLPFGEKANLGAGVQARLDETTDTNKVYNYNKLSQEYEFQPLFSNVVQYYRDIYSIYAMFNSKQDHWGYQLGLRSEYSDRLIKNVSGDSSTSIQRWDYFPSLHLSYEFPKKHQIMASYSRRIERPRGWYFEPFITWVDAYNVRRGNPELLPEYIDSYELGYSKRVKKSLFSLEGYYRVKKNSIERLRTVYQENVMLSTFQNVGTEYSLGVEGMISTDLFKWWNIDLMGNLYSFRGDYVTNIINNQSTNWGTRLNNSFYLKKNWQLQLNGRYTSATVTAQGRQEGFYVLDAAIKKTFLENKLSFTVQFSDVLQTARRQYTSSGPNFTTDEFRRRNSPIVMLNASYRINNYKSKSKRDNEEGGGDDF